jgi:uroporphyrin-III C-methyltransferase/precorrin-2 dehydrogenase/sirohydrochlorin ferrochelatase
VGAGPGDPELLTLKAVRALQSADVILFDDLISEGVLELARREAKRMMVGKRGARESCSQSDINGLMLKLAGQGKHVVRLKSGDPMVFGRAGEEIEALEAAGIPVSVVPGITSAQGMAASLNISLTHRDHAQRLSIITGHSRKGEIPETIDWARTADPFTTTVIYMGARMAGPIRDAFLAKGLAADTPVAAIASISRPEEARWFGTLGEVAEGVLTLPDGAPILIGIGRVFASAKAVKDVLEPQARNSVAA